MDCTVSSCDTMAGSSCKTGHAAYFKWDTGDALHDCTAVVCPIKIGQFIMMILQVLSFVFVMAVFGLFMGVIKPVLTWTNELTPIKQSASVMVTMFGGFGYTALLFIGYMVLPGYTLGYICYIGIFIAANVVAGLTLYIWLRTKGCDRFVEL